MRFKTGRSELLGALQSVIGVVERRQSLPVLSNLLVTADEDGYLSLLGTDLELELACRTVVEVEQPGRITVPARKLFDICRGLPEGAAIEAVLEGQRLTLRSGSSRFALSTFPADEFPALEIPDFTQSESADAEDRSRAQAVVVMPQSALRDLLGKTMFAMATQDVRYYLNGLLFHVLPRSLRTVATDGHRLAMSELALDTGVERELQRILPRKAVTELHRILRDEASPVEIRFYENRMRFDIDGVRVGSKLIDGRFPEYERVIPQGGDKELVADREMVRAALSRAAILSNEKFRGVRLQLEPGRLVLTTENPEHEEAVEELEVDFRGEPIEIGFNVNYLLDALGAMDSASFRMALKSPDASGLMTEVDGDASKYVVMPMRL